LIFFEAIVNGIVSIYSFSVCSFLVYRKGNDFCKLILYPDFAIAVYNVYEFLGL
jgi:hypothetical protein